MISGPISSPGASGHALKRMAVTLGVFFEFLLPIALVVQAHALELVSGPRVFLSGEWASFTVRLDGDETNPSAFEWRIEVGPRGIARGRIKAVLHRRDHKVRVGLPEVRRRVEARLFVRREGDSGRPPEVEEPFVIVPDQGQDLAVLFKKNQIGVVDVSRTWARSLVDRGAAPTLLTAPHAVCVFGGRMVLAAGAPGELLGFSNCLRTYVERGGHAFLLGAAARPEVLSEVLETALHVTAGGPQVPEWIALTGSGGPLISYWRPEGRVYADSESPPLAGNIYFGKGLDYWSVPIGKGWVWVSPLLIPEAWDIEPASRVVFLDLLRAVLAFDLDWGEASWVFPRDRPLARELVALGAPTEAAKEPEPDARISVVLPAGLEPDKFSSDLYHWWQNLDRWVEGGRTLIVVGEHAEELRTALWPEGRMGQGEVVHVALTPGEGRPNVATWAYLDRLTKAGVRLRGARP